MEIEDFLYFKKKMSYSAIIVGAGQGIRMKTKIPKPYLKIKNTPIIAMTLKTFNNFEAIKGIVIVTQEEQIEYCKKEIVEKYKFQKVIAVVKGGEKRQDSVKAGLELVNSEFVFIQDAVRPFVGLEIIKRLIRESEKYDAVIPGIPARDTIKKVINGIVEQTLPREQIYEIQTPQLFRTAILKKAYLLAYSDGFYGTDDSALVERLDVKVSVVEGSKHNIKITTKEDLLYAEQCEL